MHIGGQHPSASYCAIGSCVGDFHTKPNVPHPMIDIYGAFGFLSIHFEWVVSQRYDFTGVILIHVDTFHPIPSPKSKLSVMLASSQNIALAQCVSPLLVLVYNRDYEQMMSLTQKLTVFQLPRCSHANSMTQACSCHYQISIDWFPCSLKYCKSSDGNKQITYRCGIRTCGLTHMFEFPVKSRKACWWEWFQEFE